MKNDNVRSFAHVFQAQGPTYKDILMSGETGGEACRTATMAKNSQRPEEGKTIEFNHQTYF